MFVIKRNGTSEEVSFDKVYKRIKYLIAEPSPKLEHVNPHILAQYVIQGLYDGINTMEIDTYGANICASLSIKNIEYGTLAGRIMVNNHHKNTLTSFKDKMDKLYLRKDLSGASCPIISTAFYKFVKKHQAAIESTIDYSRDYLIDFFGFKTLERSYLLKIDNNIIERPQDVFMRLAIFIHMKSDELDKIFETYDLISRKYFTHATPTLFNCGLVRPQLASCFLLSTEDSLEGIMKTATDCAAISKWCGGIGFHISNWRSEGALIRGTGGKSSGIVPFLRIFNDVARAFNQGGRRNGSFAAYIEPHHPDIIAFLSLRKNHGDENLRARDLFLALWVSDLFMRRVKNNENWALLDPNECPGLADVYGEEYEKLYCEYESKGLARKVVKAREIWQAVFEAQKESGIPYISYKDAVNRSNQQKNIGIVKSSNLCNEIVEVSSSKEIATCNLSSICLSKFVEDKDEENPNHDFPNKPFFNYEKFQQVVEVMTRNLNKVIDVNYYPVPETKRSNLRHRPLGMGVQGLADVFFKCGVAFDSPEARQLNRYIFETFYYTALSTSSKMSREIYREAVIECQEKGKVTLTQPQFLDNGKTVMSKVEYTNVDDIPKTLGAYPSYLENGGCPLSKGLFHFEECGLKVDDLSTHYDWESLRGHIQAFGVRNSLLIALMPTASTSQIFGNNECFEPITSNIYKRQTLAGEFVIINKYLMRDLEKLGLWNEQLENFIKESGGSIQNIDGIPSEIKHLYRTVWEMPQRGLIDLAGDRTPFVDQSQSLNIFIENLTFSKFNSMHFYGWERGLKTGSYYVRSRPAVMAQKFTVDREMLKSTNEITSLPTLTPKDFQPVEPNSETCLVCSG